MKMTLEDYILNPMGKKNAVLNATARESIASDFLKRYGALMMREHSRMDHIFYKDEAKNRYVAHFKVPSETVEKFYYDVLFEFTADSDVPGDGSNLFKYNCRFYSNDPSFVFTYAYVFNQNDLLISQLRAKMSKKAVTTEAKEKNASNAIGYVKTIYFAYLYMKARDLNKKDIFSAEASKLVYSTILSNVEDADIKVDKRIEEGNKLQRKKAREKKIAQTKQTIKNIVNKPIQMKMGKVNTITPKPKIMPRRSNRKG